jgi:Na+/H+ antiporter NhaD/arsenite permease-like protein
LWWHVHLEHIPGCDRRARVGSRLLFRRYPQFSADRGGFGDPTVILIAALFVISAGLEASGVGAWAGQLLIQKASASRTRLLVYILLLCTGFSAVISVNGAVAAMLPIVIVVAVRTAVAPSKLLVPIMCLGHAASLLTLLGAPLNPVLVDVWQEAGLGRFGFFDFAIVGVPLVVRTIVIVLLLGDRLLPERRTVGDGEEPRGPSTNR